MRRRFGSSLRQSGPVLLAALLCAGCLSDNASFQHQREKERQQRLRQMRAATRQTEPGTSISGAALTALFSGRTYVSIFQTDPLGRKVRYIEYKYYRPDGKFIYMNSEWALDPKGAEGDRWRVDGERLCLTNSAITEEEQCYRIRVRPDRRVQFYIDQSGDRFDGLLTSIPDLAQEGPPQLLK